MRSVQSESISARSWIGIWVNAVTQPSLAGYERLILEPNFTSRALKWVVASGVASGILGSIVPVFSRLAQGEALSSGLFFALAVIPVIAVMYWLMFAGCAQGVARLLGGKGDFARLAGLVAALSSPLTIVASLLALVPWSGLLLAGLYLYWLALYAAAVQAVHGFPRTKAIGSVVLSFLLLVSVVLAVTFLAAVLSRG